MRICLTEGGPDQQLESPAGIEQVRPAVDRVPTWALGVSWGSVAAVVQTHFCR